MPDRNDGFRDADRGRQDEDPAAIRAEIQQTRDRISHTLDDISERLNPNLLKEQVKQNIRDATIGRAENMARHAADRVNETRHGIIDTIRDNPLPAAMVGIGLGWLFVNGRSSHTHSDGGSYGRVGGHMGSTGGGGYAGYDAGGTYGRPIDQGFSDRPTNLGQTNDWGSQESGLRDRAGNVAGRAQETAAELANRTRETTGELTNRARETASELAERAQETLSNTTHRAQHIARDLAEETRLRGQRIETRFQSTMQESPLVLGAAAVALGLVAGLGAPSTRRESELMGPMRDQLVDRARERVGETTSKVQNVAQRVASEAQSAARDLVDDVRETALEAVDEVKTTAREAAREEGLVGSGSGSSGSGTGSFASSGAGASGAGSTGFGASGAGSTGSGMGNTGTGMSGTGTGMSGSGTSTGAGNTGTGLGASGTSGSGLGSSGTSGSTGTGMSGTGRTGGTDGGLS